MKLRDLYQKLNSEERGRLATRAGISTVYLWQLQCGVRKNPSAEVLGKLAAADKRLKVADLVAEFSEVEAR